MLVRMRRRSAHKSRAEVLEPKSCAALTSTPMHQRLNKNGVEPDLNSRTIQEAPGRAP